MKARLAVVAAALAVMVPCVWLGAPVEAARKPRTHTVVMDAAKFSPAELTVAVGDSIVWVNKDILAHSATTKDPKTGFDSKVVLPGKSWKYTAKKKGELPYTCVFHPMNAKLIVK